MMVLAITGFIFNSCGSDDEEDYPLFHRPDHRHDARPHIPYFVPFLPPRSTFFCQNVRGLRNYLYFCGEKKEIM